MTSIGSLKGRRVLLGVSGGIAAYKAPELVRAFRREGAEVRVVMTRGASTFVTPMSLQVVSENPVGIDLMDETYEHDIGHIELARWAEVVVLAPATAHLVARYRAGLADDLLTTVLLATRASVVVCPAMNTQMLSHPAVVENLAVLAGRPQVTLVPSDEGELACREIGAGRLPDPPVILLATRRALFAGPFTGVRVCVTAGPTREYLDPVRFLSNPSSGRMGFALASAAHALGAEVHLIHGPTHVPPPPFVNATPIVSAHELLERVLAAPTDVLIMAAAVADYRAEQIGAKKRKKGDAAWRPTFVRTRDVLRDVSAHPQRPALVIGFAAETDDVLENARQKLVAKGLDGIVANVVGGPYSAFGSDTNTVDLLDRLGGHVSLETASKSELAYQILTWVHGLRASQ